MSYAEMQCDQILSVVASYLSEQEIEITRVQLPPEIADTARDGRLSPLVVARDDSEDGLIRYYRGSAGTTLVGIQRPA